MKEGRKGRQDRAAAEAGAHDGGAGVGAQDGATASVNDRADSICWFCHDDVTNLENNKCAGCRKVTHSMNLQILSFNKSLLRLATVTQGARRQTGTDMETTASRYFVI